MPSMSTLRKKQQFQFELTVCCAGVDVGQPGRRETRVIHVNVRK